MRKLLVLIPEGLSVEYFVYALTGRDIPSAKWSGRINLIGAEAANEDIEELVSHYTPDAIAIRVLYGGSEFNKPVLYDGSLLGKLEELVQECPVYIPPAIKLIKILARIIPTPEIVLFFETAFFAELPVQERVYAVDSELVDMDTRRFGYHGLFHEAISQKIKRQHQDVDRIISICLEPIPEVASIYKGKPVMVSSGSTPLEGIPGNTTCGEIDPGIVILLQEKKKLGPEMINEILTRRSGLTAILGEPATVDEVLSGGEKYGLARRILEYSILLSCGSAIALMGGFDAIAFSGRYVGVGRRLSEWLVPRLVNAAADEIRPSVFYLRDPLEQVIAQNYFLYKLSEVNR